MFNIYLQRLIPPCCLSWHSLSHSFRGIPWSFIFFVHSENLKYLSKLFEINLGVQPIREGTYKVNFKRLTLSTKVSNIGGSDIYISDIVSCFVIPNTLLTPYIGRYEGQYWRYRQHWYWRPLADTDIEILNHAFDKR